MTTYSKATEFNITPDLMIECRIYETRSTWGHTARVLRDNGDGIFLEVGTERTRYLNRTWERWNYESILYKCAEFKALTREERDAILEYIKQH